MLRSTRYLQLTNVVVLGFTGGIASGKSSRCQHLMKLAKQKANQPGVSLGVSSICADQVGHSVYAPGKPCREALLEKFGNGILAVDGQTIDRKKLGAIVFSDRKKMLELNSIVWPAINEALHEEVENACMENTVKHGKRNTFVVLEAAVLIEHGFVKHCTDVWLTSCSKEEAVRRLTERNGLTHAEAVARFESQMSIEERLKFLRDTSFPGEVRHFDTTNVSLTQGLKEVSVAFDEYWTTKLRPRFRSGPQTDSVM